MPSKICGGTAFVTVDIMQYSSLLRWNKTDQLFVVIDAANLEKSSQSLNMKVHYTRLKRLFRESSDLKEIRFYTATFSTTTHQGFLESLRRRGYQLVTKPIKEIANKNIEGKIRKANFDVEITMDVLDHLNEFDVLILFSGDSDFECLVKRIRDRGKKVFVFSTRYHISKELIYSCNHYFDIRKFKDYILKPMEK